jgi:hypothetical protein
VTMIREPGAPAPATAQELAEAMLDAIAAYGHISFAELAQAWPAHFDNRQPDGEQQLALCVPGYPNIVLWAGLSELAFDALDIVLTEAEFAPATQFVYLIDGRAVDLPVAKSARQYKSPHWLPVTLQMQKPAPERRQRFHEKQLAAMRPKAVVAS